MITNMTRYLIKCITTYEFEFDNDNKALITFEEGLWDQNDMIEENAIELIKVENNEYKIIKEYHQ